MRDPEIVSPPPACDLRPGDECRLLCAENDLPSQAFVTVSGVPYSTGYSWLVECQHDGPRPASHPLARWEEFLCTNLELCCAVCMESARPGGRVQGEAWCNLCIAHLEAQEAQERQAATPGEDLL